MIYLLAYDSFGNLNGFYSAYSSNKPTQCVKVDDALHRYLISGDYVFKSPPYHITKILTLSDSHMFRQRMNLGSNQDAPLSSSDLMKESVLEDLTKFKKEVDKDIDDVNVQLSKESQRNEGQDYDIMCTQDALDFLLFSMVNDTMNMRVSIEDTPSSKTTGGVNMGAYFTTRIIRKGKISVDMGRAYYSQVKAQYPEYIEEVDFLLISEGYENLIVK